MSVLKSIFLLMLISLFQNILIAKDFDIPEIHLSVLLQYEKYYGEDDSISGYFISNDKFSIRSAILQITDNLNEKVSYNLEFGVATCLSAGTQVQLMEAEILYKPFDFIKLGYIKGHVFRGFELNQGCSELITAEKPRFSKTFSPCHPTGAIIEFEYNFQSGFALFSQFAYLNGANGTTDKEYDINFGLALKLPIKGLSIGGYYNDIKQDFNLNGDYENGKRMNIGLDYNAYNIYFRTEYYCGKGFYSNYIDVLSKDLEMNAYFIEAAYLFNTSNKNIPFIKPYCNYQLWNKAENVNDEHEFTYLTSGICFGLGSENTTIRIDYEKPISIPNSMPDEESKLILRLQVDI